MPQILLCCVLALLLAALGLLLRSLRRRSRPSGGNETLKVLLLCFFICGILLHLPMYAAAYAGEHLSWLKALLGAVHHTLRMFVRHDPAGGVERPLFRRRHCGVSGESAADLQCGAVLL